MGPVGQRRRLRAPMLTALTVVLIVWSLSLCTFAQSASGLKPKPADDGSVDVVVQGALDSEFHSPKLEEIAGEYCAAFVVDVIKKMK